MIFAQAWDKVLSHNIVVSLVLDDRRAVPDFVALLPVRPALAALTNPGGSAAADPSLLFPRAISSAWA